MQNLLSRQDACHYLGISIATLGRILARGDIEAYRVGNLVRISPDALAMYLQRQKLFSGKDSTDGTASTTTATATGAHDSANTTG